MTNLPPPGNYPPPPGGYPPPNQPAPGGYPPPPAGGYPPPPPANYPAPQQGGYPPPPAGNYPAPPASNYPAPQQGGYPPPPAGNYPPPPAGNFAPPPPGGVGYPPGGYGMMAGSVANLPTEAYVAWPTRAAAALIDYGPIFLAQVLVYGLGMATQTETCFSYGGCVSHFNGFVNFLMFLVVLGGIGFAGWNLGYQQGLTGQSLGKSMMKIKIVAEDTGLPTGVGPSLLRLLAHGIDGFICCIGYLFPLWDAKRQTLADKIMSTVCVSTR